MRIPGEAKREIRAISINPEVWDRLRSIGKKENVPMSRVIEAAIGDRIAAYDAIRKKVLA